MSDKTRESDKTKTPDKLDKFLAGRDITLNCLISNEKVNDIFEVMISNTNNNRVSSLAEVIRICHLDRFQDIDSTNVALYRVTFIADSVIINSLRNISEFEVKGAIRMELQDTIFTHFPIQPQRIFGGNTLVNAFSVNVSELKNAIKAEKALEFDDFLADKLRLWKVPVSDDYVDPLSNLSLKNKEELLAIRKILKYFPDSPPEKHIHVLISPLEITATLSQEQELLEEVTSLQALLNKSIHNFDVIVHPKWEPNKWTANIEYITLAHLKTIPINGNEALKLQYICSYFVGIAQNAIQLESALSNRKCKASEIEEEDVFTRKTFGIITDAEKWYLMECSLDNKRKPSF
ncbi:hypothetical protein GLOIN_2v1690975 [Rhizophagus irregularis DAOM 181602=DAOM 197198]|nr:hypothetical protein GLOIN_2v1690975 [Rhizophagus irregularis DAOM 181602=DAOM 197198]